MTVYFTKELLADWDGRLVILNYAKLGMAVFDWPEKAADRATHFTMTEAIAECMKDYPGAFDFTLDWKEYVFSGGPGKSIVWKKGKFVGEGG